MSELTLTTPALLFPAISLLLLAYTNRFLAIAALIRKLHDEYQENPSKFLVGQIKNLRKRVALIRSMQFFGMASLFLCVLCMFLLFADEQLIGKWVFGTGLLLLMASLGLSLWEIQISVDALNIHLKKIEENKHTK
ncbi:DUF2721 domain-containing protein [Abyssalbus ytuae]|uniref:DUF2721 domain-containing protein n=1 Tax=Abyssalbus ytuae TaxID=2926907 RepID=A0A9E7CU30_9FLAO|nr:DUF2721 domain-containing protein [Abyssalbus ytuae]UOB19301.1 DUF2721 domain-containing protein [Abyssalbus ytuae]